MRRTVIAAFYLGLAAAGAIRAAGQARPAIDFHRSFPSSVFWREAESAGGFHSHWTQGELLAHRISPASGRFMHLPLYGIWLALLNHAGIDPVWLSLANLPLTAALAFAVAVPAGGAGAAVVSSALWMATAKAAEIVLSVYSFYSLLVLTFAAVLVWWARRRTLRRTAAMALALGGTLLCRSPLAFLPPALVLWEVFACRERFFDKDFRARALVLCVVPYLFLLPWIRLNWSLTRAFVPFENGESVSGLAGAAAGLVSQASPESRAAIEAVPPRARSETLVGVRWVLGRIVAAPGRFAWSYVRRLALVASLHPLLFLLAAAGAFAGRARREVQVLALFCLYFLLLHGLLLVMPDYYLPFWPCCCALASCSVAGFLPRAEGWDERADSLIGGLGFAWLSALLVLDAAAGLQQLRFASGRADRKDAAALDQALARRPNDQWLLHEKALLRLVAGDAAGAEALLERVKGTVDSARESLDLAWIRALAGRPAALLGWQLPAQYLAAPLIAIDVHEPVTWAHFLRADFLAQAGRKRDAAAELAAGFDLLRERRDPEAVRGTRWVTSHGNGATVWPPWGELAVQAPSGAAPAPEPAVVASRFREAEAAIRDGKTASALRSLAKAEAAGLSPAQMRRAAALYQSLMAYPRAAALLSTVARGPQAGPDDFNDLGVNEFLGGSLEAAARDLETAIRLKPGLLSAYATLAAVYAAQGKPGEALRVYSAAAKIEPAAGEEPAMDAILRSRDELLRRRGSP